MIVGLDIGYGYTKVATSDGKLFMFKTAVSKYIPEQVWGDNNESVLINSTEYLIGDIASDNISGNLLVSDDFVGNSEYYAIIAKVLDTIKEDVDLLVLGLPPGLYTEKKTSELIKKFSFIIMKNALGQTIKHPTKTVYIPQGSGIYFSHIFNGNSNDFNANVVVIDIGFYTLDIVFFSKGKFINAFAKSYPMGSKFLIEKVKEAFSKQYGIFINDSLSEIILKTGKISYFGQQYNLDTELIINQYYQDQIMRVIKDYATIIRQQGKTVDKVIIGGGGIIWSPIIKGTNIVDNSQMANAIGYMKYGLNYYTQHNK